MTLREIEIFINTCKSKDIDIPEDIIALVNRSDFNTIPADKRKLPDLEYNVPSGAGRIKIINKDRYIDNLKKHGV